MLMASDFGWAIYQGDFDKYSRDDLQDLWIKFCEAREMVGSGFSKVLWWLASWAVAYQKGRWWHVVRPHSGTGWKNPRPGDFQDSLEGERPAAPLSFERPLDASSLPAPLAKLKKFDVFEMRKRMSKMLEDKGFVPLQQGEHVRQPLELSRAQLDSWATTFCTLLHVEELQMSFDIGMYDMSVAEPLQKTFVVGVGQLYSLDVPGVAEKRPSVLRGDAVLVSNPSGRYKAYVHQVQLDKVSLSFHANFKNQPPFQVKFFFTRTPLKLMHRALHDVQPFIRSIYSRETPTVPLASVIVAGRTPARRALNDEQRRFVDTVMNAREIVDKKKRRAPLPLLLWGPPGTGKTTTVVAAILEVIQNLAARVLVTAPSNAAADVLCERLGRESVSAKQMLRLNGMLRSYEEMPASLRPYARWNKSTFEVPPQSELMTYTVIVSTCTSAGYLASRSSSSSGWFTHVFVDEAAQAVEPEALIPVSVLEPGGLLVLAGDFRQLGPIIRSPVAVHYGLDVSLLERVVKHIGIDHARVHPLLQTYRAHPSILRLYNETIYGSMLRCCSPPSSYDMVKWQMCTNGEDSQRHPVVFHHVEGSEQREVTSPSWSNPDEVEAVRSYIQALKSFGVSADDVGVISPYQLQCKRLKLMCKTESFDAAVGTTEQYQGREKRVILVSTVRSQAQDEVPRDMKFALGFVGNLKRSNVALSRARSALVLVGNLRLLSADAHWHHVIKIAQHMGCCRGQPFELQRPWVVEDRVQGSRQGADHELVARPWRVLE